MVGNLEHFVTLQHLVIYDDEVEEDNDDNDSNNAVQFKDQDVFELQRVIAKQKKVSEVEGFCPISLNCSRLFICICACYQGTLKHQCD